MRDQARDDARRFEETQEAPAKGSRMPSTAYVHESGLKDYYILPGMVMAKTFFHD